MFTALMVLLLPPSLSVEERPSLEEEEDPLPLRA
jgi:hypothetical protein